MNASDDGTHPAASPIDAAGILYGTTSQGGAGCESGSSGSSGCGTVFSIGASGAERLLYSFKGGRDGRFPQASLIDVNGTFYGTTSQGGGLGCPDTGIGCGTVFSLTAQGAERVLHRFDGGADGSYPHAGVVDVNGTLYGTTSAGGAYGGGTVFSVSTTGEERVLHSFGNGADGRSPQAGLIDVNGTLYGTTSAGGGSGCGGIQYGCGTVFSVSTTGKERVLHRFGTGTDGRAPQAALIDVGGTLYGTTSAGGTGCAPSGCGTVFSVSTNGTERVLHEFESQTRRDGASSLASLVDVNGTLYGTTALGGTSGCGTVFSLSTAGAERVLYNLFPGGDCGTDLQPQPGLVYSKNTLYGVTTNEGFNGSGTVFALEL